MATIATNVLVWMPVLVVEDSYDEIQSAFKQIFSDSESHAIGEEHV